MYGGLKESHQSEVEISEASVNSFKKLLEYIYSGRMNLSVLKVKLIYIFQIKFKCNEHLLYFNEYIYFFRMKLS